MYSIIDWINWMLIQKSTVIPPSPMVLFNIFFFNIQFNYIFKYFPHHHHVARLFWHEVGPPKVGLHNHHLPGAGVRLSCNLHKWQSDVKVFKPTFHLKTWRLSSMPDFIWKPDDQSPKAGLCTALRLFPRGSSLRGREQCQLPEGD